MLCHVPFFNIHKVHKVLLINDELALKKENITFESSTKQYNDLIPLHYS